MKIAAIPETLVERIAQIFNLGPSILAEAMFGMAQSQTVTTAAKLGIFTFVCTPKTADAIIEHFSLQPEGTRQLLDCLTAAGHLRRSKQQPFLYELHPKARKWLDPQSPTYVGDFIALNHSQWAMWSNLDACLQKRQFNDLHLWEEHDDRWNAYIRAMHQLARLFADEVAAKVPVPAQARSVLDMAGGHGWFSAKICERYNRRHGHHPAQNPATGLQATVLDLAGSCRIGRQIMQEHRLENTVRHVVGDIFTSNLQQLTQAESIPHDVVLLFRIVRHFTVPQIDDLLQRAFAALKPGGTLAVLDHFSTPAHEYPRGTEPFVDLHFHLINGVPLLTVDDLHGALSRNGFVSVAKRSLIRFPLESLHVAVRPR